MSVDTSVDEMEKFIGFHIMMGVFRLPQVHLYGQENLRIPYISDVMARNRFLKLRTVLYINDKANMIPWGQPDHNKLFKIRPLVDALYTNLCVDEFMIQLTPFRIQCHIWPEHKNQNISLSMVFCALLHVIPC